MAYIGRVRRWDVFWADLEPAVGSEQGGARRPVVIVSNDRFNAAMNAVTVLPLTKLEGKRRQPYAFEAVLPSGTLGEGITSIVMPQQIRTISKLRLIEAMGRIANRSSRDDIEDRLLEHLGIELDE
jgi:mRNA interferase MazF